MTPHEAPPLWRQLQAAAAVFQAVRAGGSATPAIAAVPPALRGGVQALAFQSLRQLGRAEALRSALARRPPPAAADALLCTALALAWDEAAAPYDAHTLVNQAVEAAKRQRSTQPQAGFVNACLRRFLREREALVAATDAEPRARWNHPPWWIDRLQRDHPTTWQEVLQAGNAPAPLVLRVNVAAWTVDAAWQALAEAGIESQRVGAAALRLERPRPVTELPGFAQGRLSVQDAAAQLAAPLLLGAIPREQAARLRVLDACAAPGGKTAHLLELGVTDLTALDVDPARCARIHENLARLGLSARVLAADAGDPAAWWDGEPYDAILLDAPCTASGIVRRHPDVRWLRRDSDVAALATVQARLLATLWPLLRSGGRLLYCTCSVFKAEGEDTIRSFLAHNTDAFSLPAPGHLLPRAGANAPALPDNLPSDHDGFYYALLQKRSSAHLVA
ncbi:16S rRNA (cytosine(967)-C(5))-methyltransferase RsmB [Ramlibacter rhizophilus]|uniref:16S rRNA (cytosine(967)-C(5))-methyltransferase n=1 Tax=Ramlibacter rhizophilus TaxID=1781167 RepID=A0A4Z0BG21_9BURK|nr:16S rRNA (cytosine(967)-C(5))-methyltransferase RsmB [Ramlibacter rhizophilus]TFY97237.1 16S rRNA (cytosine(967)-C(5))-methyltransferase RsmB [Ramlibacter rhizophilus]